MANVEGESEFLFHCECENCGSSDANGVYDDGHQYCFACEHYTAPPADDEDQPTSPEKETRHMKKDVLPPSEIEVRRIGPRGINEETVKKWGYGYSRFDGKKVHVASYRNERGTVVAQKVRSPNKEFTVLGNLKEALPLYGQWLWKTGGKRVVVTEGEIDALTVSQVQGNKWPVVSVPTGAAGAKKSIAKAIEWLESFDEVVFMFDDDEPGRKATAQCVPMLSPGKAKVATVDGFKDANAALVAGKSDAIMQAIWNAKPFRPDGIMTLTDLRSEITKPIERGLPWFSETLTELTFGRRYGEVIAFGAGTGVGKTDFLTQQIQFDITDLGEPVGVFMLEQQPVETAKRICGKFAGKRFHVPDESWTQDELLDAFGKVEKTGKLYLYDHFGVMDWDVIEKTIRYLHHSEGVRIFYLDHLTALATGVEDRSEREELERIMAEVASLAKELNILIHLVSHLATPEGKPHEEGGRVSIRHFKGSRAIGFWCHFMFGLERNQQAEDEFERQTTTFRVLKDRLTGQSVGKTIFFGYDADEGLLFETSPEFGNESGSSEECPF